MGKHLNVVWDFFCKIKNPIRDTVVNSESPFKKRLFEKVNELRARHRADKPRATQTIKRTRSISDHGRQQLGLGARKDVTDTSVALNGRSDVSFSRLSPDFDNLLELLDHQSHWPML